MIECECVCFKRVTVRVVGRKKSATRCGSALKRKKNAKILMRGACARACGSCMCWIGRGGGWVCGIKGKLSGEGRF